MVLFNYSTRELTAKIVFYGPGLCGKTTNLQYIHSTLPDNVKGKMLSLATKTDRTLFFDFLPIDLGQIRGMKTRVQLYTVPGQVFYNETRKLVLKGADGIVFVADSQTTMLGANVESFKNLEENLKAHGLKLAEMPHVLQFNKRDLPRLSSIEELNSAINRYNAPFYESVATTGIGVQDTLKAITKLVLLHLTKKYDPKTAAASTVPPTPVSVAAATRGQRRSEEPPPQSRPTPPPAASPAQTIQMPAAPFGTDRVEAPRSIPVSGPAAAASPGRATPPSFGHEIEFTDPVPDDPTPDPAFADDEIQELVDEVQDSELGYESDSFGTVQFDAVEMGTAPASESKPAHDVASFDEPSLEATGSAPEISWQADPEPTPAPRRKQAPNQSAAASGLEIDHGADPDWSSGSPEPAAMESPDFDRPPGQADDNVWDLGAMDDDPLSLDPAAAESSAPVEERTEAGPAGHDLPRLTDVVDDDDLFGAAGLDVAHLTAGEEREVVVPVEFRDDNGEVRRFKLSIRMRLDSVG